MSDISQSASIVPGARELRAQSAIWLERRDCADWNLEAQAELDAWLAQSPGHMVAYLRAEAAWQRADRLSAFGPAMPESANPAQPRPFAPMLLKIAAALGLVTVLGVAATAMFARPHERMFSTPVGGRETINFADGSQIELNTNTVLRARMTTEERVVWLDKGEAFFRIKHDPAHPFVVMVGDHRVTDLGTKFLIDRGPKKIEVALIEGRAWFDRTGKQQASQTALLTPGDEVVATALTMSVAKKPASEIAAELSWRNGILVFRGTTLGDAAAQFNRYNRQKMVVADAKAAAIRIDGTFPTNGVGIFTDAIRNVFGLHIENRGQAVVISTAQ